MTQETAKADEASSLTESNGPLAAEYETPEAPRSSLLPATPGPGQLPPAKGGVAAADPTSSCRPSSGSGLYCIHVVQPGETLSGIARQAGLTGAGSVSAAQFLAVSNELVLSELGLIQPGQELRVPLRQGVLHSVQVSESLGLIASQYGASIADIASANAISDFDGLTEGQTLLVPDPTDLPPTVGAVEQPPPAPSDGSTAAEAAPDARDEAAQTSPRAASADVQADPQDEEGSSEEQAALDPEVGETTTAASSTEVSDADPEPASEDPDSPPSSDIETVREQFTSGYRSADGPEEYLSILLDTTIPCESSYRLDAYNPVGPFFGLLQFLPWTWADTGGGDWEDPWQQGANAGRLLQTARPTTQWPYCWPA